MQITPQFKKCGSSQPGLELAFFCLVIGYAHELSPSYLFKSGTKPKFFFFGLSWASWLPWYSSPWLHVWFHIHLQEPNGQITMPHSHVQGQYSGHLWPDGNDPHCPSLKKIFLQLGTSWSDLAADFGGNSMWVLLSSPLGECDPDSYSPLPPRRFYGLIITLTLFTSSSSLCPSRRKW